MSQQDCHEDRGVFEPVERMGLCTRQIEHLTGRQVMPRAACRKDNSTFKALDRDFSGHLMFRNVLSRGNHQANDFQRLGLY